MNYSFEITEEQTSNIKVWEKGSSHLANTEECRYFAKPIFPCKKNQQYANVAEKNWATIKGM